MIWFLRILFDKELKKREVNHRKALIMENDIFIEELKKLDRQMRQKSCLNVEDDLYYLALKNLKLSALINVLTNMNLAINILFISRARVDKFTHYIRTLKDYVNDLVEKAKINQKLDSFTQVQAPKVATFKNLSKLKLDKFINS